MNTYYREGLSYPFDAVGTRNLHDDLVAPWTPYLPAIAYALASSVFVYFLLIYLNILPPFTFSKIVWRLIVMLSPAPLVFALDKDTKERGVAKNARELQESSDTAAKEEALRRIFHLDRMSFLPKTSIAQGNANARSTHLRAASPAPPGLGNFNNSCYQNSVIQGLASLRQLDSFLENNLQMLGHGQTMSTHVSLKETIVQLNDFSNTGRRLWLPRELKSMSSWQQQDAQEYYSKVVEQIDKEISHASKSRSTNNGFKVDVPRPPSAQSSSPDAVPENDIFRRIGVDDLAGPFDNPLEGLTAQRVGCMDCGYCEGLSLIPFTCLTVPLAPRAEYDVRDCLDDYTALEPIEGVECMKCTVLRIEAGLLEFLDKLSSNDWSQLEPNEKAQKETLSSITASRLKAVQEALRNEDFFEKTLSEKCRLNAKNRVSSTKSRQSVIARAPKSLAIHINRSMFDEFTGVLRKNYARVIFPEVLDLDEWCLGSKQNDQTDDVSIENWEADPTKSMLSSPRAAFRSLNRKYELRAVITHYGQHDDGHYICYRKFLTESLPAETAQTENGLNREEREKDQWFELSDADVYPVSNEYVLSQGGVFMLFYELIETAPASLKDFVGFSSQDLPEDTFGNSPESRTDLPD